ncbi:MAG TPA: glycosyltransferase [Patescibacteria group bacterium]|nr:glycosyltransferase [Patescibacteria group bacterium]
MDSLKNKKILLATWGLADKDNFECRDWIPLFKKMFGKLITFTMRNYYYHHGKEALNSEFLRIIQTEKPDYLLFGPGFYSQLDIQTISKIKTASPLTKTIIEFGDDDWRFEDWSRYYALFFDYIITTKKETEIYKNDGIKRAIFLHGMNTNFFKPMNLEKKYDVSFIGRPVADRYEYIKFLKENGIKIRLFGIGWQTYPDLKEIYEGVLYNEDYPRVINQSKININFSKTLYKKGAEGQLKGRSLEVPACNSFMLNEYTDRNVEFLNKKKEINFRSKEELLEKIKYYLKHEKERERIAKDVYDYMTKHYAWDILFGNFFKRIEKDKSESFKLPNISKKIEKISKKDFNLSYDELAKKLKNIDFIFFDKDHPEYLLYRNYLQAYSLHITKKPISCCDYFINSPGLGDYMLSMIKESFYTLNKNDFYKILNVNQLMVEKDFFLKNIENFKKLFLGKNVDLINEENTAFVTIPLVRVSKIPSVNYSSLKKALHMNFIDMLFYLFYRKKIDSYLFSFLLIFLRKNAVRKYLVDYLKDTKSLSNIMKTF